MALKPGDVYTLRASPSVQLLQYQLTVRPGAEVTRTLGLDVQADVLEMEAELRQGVMRSLCIELGIADEILERYLESGTPGLVKYCLENLDVRPEYPATLVGKPKARKKEVAK